jgi:hypothetical protein
MLKEVDAIIENTTMQKYIDDKTGQDRTYWIKPVEGYKLHSIDLDTELEDPETGAKTKEIGFTQGIVTCSVNYDFENNLKEFYAVPENETFEPVNIESDTATVEDYQKAQAYDIITGGAE